MSVFCLILAPHGSAVTADAVSRLLDPVAALGVFGRSVWVEDNLGLGLLHCSAPPDAGPGTYPHQALSDHLVLAADVRLDARQELMAALSYPTAQRTAASDEDLLLAAYVRWGTDCPRHLLGDFAFVVYNRATREVFGAADALGNRRLFFSELDSGDLVIASEEACLIAVPGLTEKWSEVAVACWLTAAPHRQLSLFERIGVVAGGQELRGTAAGAMNVRQWWTAEPTHAIRYRRLDDYAEHYRGLLQLAVAERMPAGPVLCELSGGLDSSTITAAAVEAAGTDRVAALSLLYPGYGGCDEGAVIADTRAWLKLSNWHGVVDRPAPFVWDEAVARSESPYLFKVRLQEDAVTLAVKLGCKVIFTGFGGDEHTRGNRSFSAVARLGRGDVGIIRELRELSRGGAIPLSTLVQDRLVRTTARRLLPQWLVREIEVRRMIRARLPAWLQRNQALLGRLREQYRRDSRSSGQNAYHRSILLKFRHSTTWASLDGYRWSARSRGIDARAPFFDLRITGFVLNTPPDLWCRNGYGKLLVRRAFRERLPESILTRDKVFYTEVGQHRWTAHREALLREIALAQARTGPGSQLAALLPGAGDDFESVNRFSVLYAASLARWSNSRGQRGIDNRE